MFQKHSVKKNTVPKTLRATTNAEVFPFPGKYTFGQEN